MVKRRQYTGLLRGVDVNGKACRGGMRVARASPLGAGVLPNAGFPGLVPRDRGYSRLPPALPRHTHSQCGPWHPHRPACVNETLTWRQALWRRSLVHDTIVGGASGQQVVPIPSVKQYRVLSLGLPPLHDTLPVQEVMQGMSGGALRLHPSFPRGLRKPFWLGERCQTTTFL